MMKRRLTTITISEKLVEMACERYAEKKISASIINGLLDFFLLPKKSQRTDSFSLHQLLNIKERQSKKNISIRLPEALFNMLSTLQSDSTFSETVEIILATSLYFPLEKANFPKESLHLLRVMGSKFDSRMEDAISHIFKTAGRKWETSVETCAGALGIHCNHHLATKREFINDDDWEKINLYKAVKENPRQLLLHALSLDASPAVFNELKRQPSVQPTNVINYAEAAKFLFLNANSYLNDGSTFLTGMNNRRWLKRLISIYPLHKRLQNTKIVEADLFKVINKYRALSNALFIVDPPYLDTNVYRGRTVRNETENGKEFGWSEHQKLAKLLSQLKTKNGNDFIYFCRITATRKKNKVNHIVSTTKELRSNDQHIKGMVDDLYYGHGFYYLDVELDNGTLERIITSFPFEGATLYGGTSN